MAPGSVDTMTALKLSNTHRIILGFILAITGGIV